MRITLYVAIALLTPTACMFSQIRERYRDSERYIYIKIDKEGERD